MRDFFNRPKTMGHLTDMNLIDLLQALGPSRKTARIVVKPAADSSHPLILYLKAGSILHASLKEMEGPQAVYEAMTWNEGTWVVQPVSAEDLPEPNNRLSNDTVLMEGCRLIDEQSRSMKPA